MECDEDLAGDDAALGHDAPVSGLLMTEGYPRVVLTLSGTLSGKVLPIRQPSYVRE